MDGRTWICQTCTSHLNALPSWQLTKHTRMLADLKKLVERTKANLDANFTVDEIILSDEFKTAYKNVLAKERRDTVEFLEHTAVFTTESNKLKIYAPNQWFIIAAYTVEYIQRFREYKVITDKIVEKIKNQLRTTEQKFERNFYDNLRDPSKPRHSEALRQFEQELNNFLPVATSEEENANNRSNLISFVTDYSWWSGKKTIDRADSYESPTLSMLGVVNVSQGHIAKISELYANYPELAAVAQGMADMATQAATQNQSTFAVSETTEGLSIKNNARLTGGINEIVCGAPGTGKSRYLQENYGFSTECTRVVFHPEYTSFDFVGNYKPVTLYRETSARITTLSGELFEMGEPMVDYKYVPGPFITTLAAAWKNPDKMYTLIIEEINRANAAAVFAEIFQLLDRDSSGTSIYSIKPSEELQQYLFSFAELRQYLQDGLRIPSNLNIVATMNSADQGVIPMDSAFKRRWSFKYMRINIDRAIHSTSIIKYASRDISWGEFIKAVNKKLMGLGVDEDRLIGPYFITPEELGNNAAINKLLLYLWDDVLRHNRGEFFNNQIQTYADLSECFALKDVLSIDNEP